MGTRKLETGSEKHFIHILLNCVFVCLFQKLYELRDKIPCALDSQPIGNFTDAPDFPRDTTLKDICTSSFFYIENTFFNDFRSAANIDLSK